MAIRDTSVKFFASTQTGAPSLNNSAGTLVSLLDAVLTAGFGSVVADSLVVSGGIATLTRSAGHGFDNPGAGEGIDVGVVIAVSGVTGALAALNAEWRATVTSSTVLTWECGLANGTATGTISAKRAPAGWTKAYSGSNAGAYSRTAPGATAMLLNVDDSVGSYAVLTGYETMSAINVGTGSFGGQYCFKASSATLREWFVIATDRDVYLICDGAGAGSFTGGFFFGDIVSYAALDPYAACLICSATTSGINQLYLFSNIAGGWICRSYAGSPGGISVTRETHKSAGAYICSAGNPWPAAASQGAHFWPIEVWENSTTVRGRLPGILNPIHSVGPTAKAFCVGPVADLGGGAVMMVRLALATRSAGFLITKPWR